MVMPRYMDVAVKKDGTAVFETTISRGCIMEPNEKISVIQDALTAYKNAGYDTQDWSSVSINNGPDISKEDFLQQKRRAAKNRMTKRGPFGL